MNEVLITVNYQGRMLDISVDAQIRAGDLSQIVARQIGAKEGRGQLFSRNHNRLLNSGLSLYDEKIWDGDILDLLV